MLSNQYYPGKTITDSASSPTLVFLHGFLGDGREWLQVIEQLADYPCLTIDLCRHGGSAYRECLGFDQVCHMIQDTIVQRLGATTPVILVGYSLGARIAMYGLVQQGWQDANIIGVISEGGNFGLKEANQRQRRLISDEQWAKRFSLELIVQVLNDWYQQPIFSGLNHEQRQSLVELRSDNLGVCIAEMLIATSLGKQPYLLDALMQQSVPVHYICGAEDEKFSLLAQHSGLPYTQVANAGHNVHREQPSAFVACVHQFVAHVTQKS
jgi:2-succinyl-6-hydroxy-2,4-cyclohexadiene-1-carboxylate synthase